VEIRGAYSHQQQDWRERWAFCTKLEEAFMWADRGNMLSE
jgi:hypothetical protein